MVVDVAVEESGEVLGHELDQESKSDANVLQDTEDVDVYCKSQ